MADLRTIAKSIWKKTADFLTQLEPVQFVVDPQPDSRMRPNIICHFDPKSVISEEYRTIRTNLQFALSGFDRKTFLVTSSINQEGKSVTTINLATVLAQTLEKPLLIVDCDLRKPTMHKYLGLDMDGGVTDFFQQDVTVADLVKETEIPHLHALTCGGIPKNPSEILGSRRMDELIRQAGEMYEYVIFDSPPIVPVTDAAVLGPRLSGVLMLVKSDDTQRETVAHAYRLLKQAKTNILGIVLTNARQYIPRYLSRYQYYHYYHYYHYKQ